jgi:radical SAM protein with 4Fe4S-binding SPASM domain
MDDNGAVHDKLKHLQIRLRTHGWEGNSRAGVLDDSLVVTDQRHPPTPKHDTPILCGRDLLYDNNMLLPNGDVLLCCQDWAMNHVIGNLFNNSYYEIFGSAEMSRIRKENMKMGFSDKSICRKCVHAIPVINDEKQTTKAINSKNNNGTMNSSITKKIKMALKHSRSGW